ncbi:MAG: hypothetical protein ACRC33_01475 [Gemmataceae bacterium]
MEVVARLLVLIACGLTVPPPGWCCAALRWAAATPEAACRSCCCPHETPPEGNAPPARSWCCERDPATPTRPADFDVPDLSFTHFIETVWSAPVPVRFPASVADVVVPDDPLHVLHCVWLC